jgi:hypothetical protein
MTEEQLSALLRLKRHEQPPPGYFDDLLRDVHRRQREDLLQRPLWQIALERLQCFFGERSFAPLSYAGALAAVVIVGVASIHSMNPQSERMAQTGKVLSFGEMASARTASATPPALSLQPGQESLISQQAFDVSPGEASHIPRYVIDARPVSYVPTFSF